MVELKNTLYKREHMSSEDAINTIQYDNTIDACIKILLKDVIKAKDMGPS
jgi:hypothetical protein